MRHKKYVLLSSVVCFIVGLLLGVVITFALTIHLSPQTKPVVVVTRIVETLTPTGTPVVVCVNPLIPLGKLPSGTKYSKADDLKSMPSLLWDGVRYLKIPGKNGRLWGMAGGRQILLYGASSAYCL